MSAELASRAQCDKFQVVDGQCHRRLGHPRPHHADSGLAWGGFRRGPRTRTRHYPDCPGRDGQCGALDEDGKRQCHRLVGHRGPHHAKGLVWGGRWRRRGTRYLDYTDCPGCGGFKAVAALVLPRTLAPRLTFLGIVLFAFFFCPIPVWLQRTFFGLAVVVFVLAIAVAFEEIDEYEQRSPGERGVFPWLFAVVGGGYVLPVALAFLVTLVSPGHRTFVAAFQFQPYLDAGLVGWARIVVVLATLWLVIGDSEPGFHGQAGR